MNTSDLHGMINRLEQLLRFPYSTTRQASAKKWVISSRCGVMNTAAPATIRRGIGPACPSNLADLLRFKSFLESFQPR